MGWFFFFFFVSGFCSILYEIVWASAGHGPVRGHQRPGVNRIVDGYCGSGTGLLGERITSFAKSPLIR
jgi:hypothetical protein